MKPFVFGNGSLARLDTCHPDLIQVASRAIATTPYDFAIIEGHRSLERQRELYAQGLTRIDGVTEIGKHNHTPSLAFDFMPYPASIDGEDVWTDGLWRFDVIAGVILASANSLGVALRWGGDWDGDGARRDQRLHDRPHIELLTKGVP